MSVFVLLGTAAFVGFAFKLCAGLIQAALNRIRIQSEAEGTGLSSVRAHRPSGSAIRRRTIQLSSYRAESSGRPNSQASLKASLGSR